MWHFLRHFAVRRTGFPFEIIQSLACPASFRELEKEDPSPLEPIFSAEFRKTRMRLKEISENPRFREALFLSNPAVLKGSFQHYLHHWTLEKRPSDIKRIEKQLISYLQRFTTKCDTNSFFGPISEGLISPAATALEGKKQGEWVVSSRRPFMAYWGVAALAAEISRDAEIRSALLVRKDPFAEITGPLSAFSHFSGQSYDLSSEEGELLACLSCEPSPISEAAGKIGKSPAEIEKVLIGLKAKGLIRWEIEAPSGIPDVLEWLCQVVEDLPPSPSRERWKRALEKFRDLKEAFSLTDLEGRGKILGEAERYFTLLTGKAPSRGEGLMYVDRTLFYEECLGDPPSYTLSEGFAREILRLLTPVMDLGGRYGQLLLADHRKMALELFDRLWPGKEEIPYPTFMSGLPEEARRIGFERKGSDSTVFLKEWEQHALSPSGFLDLARKIAPFLAQESLHTSVDLMFCSPSPEALKEENSTIILSELHSPPVVWETLVPISEKLGEIREEIAARLLALPCGKNLCGFIYPRDNKFVPYELPSLKIDCGTLPSWKDKGKIAPMSRTRVRRNERGLDLCLDDGQPLVLHFGESVMFHFGIFCLPAVQAPVLSSGKHSRRITIGNLVYQRERWDLGGQDLPEFKTPSALDLFVSMNRFRRQWKMPRHVFLKVPREIKPYYVDFANPLLLELAASVLKTATRAEFTEMLPAPEDLWLKDPEGRYCSEFRMMAFRSGENLSRESSRD